MPRPGETRVANKSEFDLKNSVWTILAERMKSREHKLPLSKQAMAIVEANWPQPEEAMLHFPSLGSNRKSGFFCI